MNTQENIENRLKAAETGDLATLQRLFAEEHGDEASLALLRA